MLFNSWQFLLFFPVVVLSYFLMPVRWRNYWLLITSYYFYMGWNAKYALLLLFSTIVTFFSGIALSAATEKYHGVDGTLARKFVVAVSLLLNFSVLFFFKYFDFLVDSLNEVFSSFRIQLGFQRLDLLLPVGISFYIFQAFSYTIDVYRGNIRAEKNFFKYALFVSFFPQLVAGPIERSTNLLPQFDEHHDFDPIRVTQGLRIMLWGFFQKVIIADTIAPVVDHVYSNWRTQSGLQIVLATILFAFQIYCDFGGYSQIAIGAAKGVGFRLMMNFRQPYFAVSIQDFWRRWHISLSTWFRDYVYIPLGGNRKGLFRKKINLMVVFLLSGLWHGANWTYVVWGGLNGGLQLINVSRGTKSKNWFNRIWKSVVTFILIDITWLFFRAESISQVWGMLKRLLILPNVSSLGEFAHQMNLNKETLLWICGSLFVLLVVDLLHEKRISIGSAVDGLPKPIRWVCYIAICELFILHAIAQYGKPATAFIYFQF